MTDAELIRELRNKIDEQQKEIAVSDKLIEDRNRLVDLFDCPKHGHCVPHAVEQVEAFLAAQKAIKELSDLFFKNK